MIERERHLSHAVDALTVAIELGDDERLQEARTLILAVAIPDADRRVREVELELHRIQRLQHASDAPDSTV